MIGDLPGDSFRRILAAEQQREKLMRLADPYASLRSRMDTHSFDRAQHLADMWRDLDGGWRRRATDSVREALEAHSRAMRDATGPLMRLRAETLYEKELARAALLAPRNHATEIADELARQRARLLADVSGSMRLTETVAEQVRRTMEEQTRRTLIDAARPFASISDHVQRQLAGMTGLFDGGEWARKMGMATLDAASLATVARAWGIEGTLRNIRELGGVDRATLRALADALEAEDDETTEDEEADESTTAGRSRKQRGALSFGDIVAILSIVLTLLIWDAQNRDSEEMEARLRQDNRALVEHVQKSEERTARRIEDWSRLAEELLARAQTPRAAEFVVRSRGAQIKSRKGGRATVAEALPGQVVTLIAEEGKWIEIHYLDFATGKQQAGWALKKYFVRVAPRTTPDGEEESE